MMKLAGFAIALSLAFGGTAMAQDSGYRHGYEHSRYETSHRYEGRRHDDRPG